MIRRGTNLVGRNLGVVLNGSLINLLVVDEIATAAEKFKYLKDGQWVNIHSISCLPKVACPSSVVS